LAAPVPVTGDNVYNEPENVEEAFMPTNKRIASITFVSLVATAAALAQMGTGRITGKITDPGGNPIEDAVITFTDQTGRELTGTSEEDGSWAILGFRTGTYDFHIQAEGYQPKVEKKSVQQMGDNELDVVLVPLQPMSDEEIEGSNTLLREANELLRQKQYQEAIAKYEELLEAQPSVYQTREFIGVAYREMGDYEAALAQFHKVLEQDAQHEGALISIGDILVEQQKLDEAVEYFEKAVAQTSDAIVPFNVAEIYFNQGNAAKAIEYYKIAAEYRADWADPHLKMGYAYLNTGDMEGAKSSFQKVVEIAPDTPQAQMAQAALSSLQ
jgi:tetratricopeptide (TPR) repeat protein